MTSNDNNAIKPGDLFEIVSSHPNFSNTWYRLDNPDDYNTKSLPEIWKKTSSWAVREILGPVVFLKLEVELVAALSPECGMIITALNQYQSMQPVDPENA